MDATGVRRVADRAGDVGAVGDVADPGCDRRRCAAGRTARGQRCIARIDGAAVQPVVGEPAVAEGRRVGAPDDDRAGLEQVVDHRAVAGGDPFFLQVHAVAGREAYLVDVYLDGNRHARERSGIIAARQRRIDSARTGQNLVGSMVDDRVDRRVDGIQPRQRRLRGLDRRELALTHERGDAGRRQAPDFR